MNFFLDIFHPVLPLRSIHAFISAKSKILKKNLKGPSETPYFHTIFFVPSGQPRPHQTLFHYKKQWFLEHVYNCLLFVYLYVWCLEGGFLR